MPGGPELRAVGGDRGGVLTGVVLGEDEGLSDTPRDRFRAAGLYHLLRLDGQTVRGHSRTPLALGRLDGEEPVEAALGELRGGSQSRSRECGTAHRLPSRTSRP